MVPSPPPYGLLFHNIGVLEPGKTLNAFVSGTGEATVFKFGRNIHRVHPNAH